MPEIAEVHCNLDTILIQLLNRILNKVTILSGKYAKKSPENFHEFQASLPSKLVYIGKKGKFGWMEFENGWIVGFGFGMTGKFTTNQEYRPHLIRIEFHSDETTRKSSTKTSKHQDELNIYYRDQRNFGNFYFWPSRDQLEEKLKTLGPDLLENPEMPLPLVVKQFRKKPNWEIARALLDQSIFAGVGNYLRAEALYSSEIYPFAKIKNLTDYDLYDLYHNLVRIAQEAYMFQMHEFTEDTPYEEYQDQMQVYQHKHDPEGNPVRQDKTPPGDRTIHWVPKVQIIGK